MRNPGARTTLIVRTLSGLLLALVGACSSEASSPPVATELQCPTPGALPFQLTSSGFQSPDNAAVGRDNPRNKDEASDTLGNPSGKSANVYLDNATPSGTTLAHFHGRKARTTSAGGLAATALPGENVSLWQYDRSQAKWVSRGQTKTDESGYYDVAATVAATTTDPVYAILEADGSCTKHEGALLPPGSNVVVTDIDGTLTTNDAELYKQLSDGEYLPAMMGHADALIQRWSAKKYPVVYLTARPHLFRADSITWLEALHFPVGSMVTSNTLLVGDTATAEYKTAWMHRMIDDFGWHVVAAYGNALSDIEAYQAAGLPNEHIFIVGPNAGASGTTTIADEDYAQHITAFVETQPDNQ